MIKRFVKAMLKWAASGFKTTTPELAEKRKVICMNCASYLQTRDKCMECGCMMALKRKLPNENCPVGKW